MFRFVKGVANPGNNNYCGLIIMGDMGDISDIIKYLAYAF